MTKETRRQRADSDPLYEGVSQAARRLTIGVPAMHGLINTGVIPARRLNGRHKIPKLAVGELLASAYEIWPPERRPHYSIDELRKLGGITVEKVAAQLGMGRTAGYDAVRNHQIPARKLPNIDRWIVPEDVVLRMEVCDLENLPPAPLSEDEPRSRSPHCEAEDPVTCNKGVRKDPDPSMLRDPMHDVPSLDCEADQKLISPRRYL